MTNFIGIDMAWNIDANHTGIAVMVGDERRVVLDSVSTGVTSLSGIVDFVQAHADANSVIAIDASLIVKNETGQRPCETLIAREFGKYHACCHTTNRSRPYWDTGQSLVRELRERGVEHDFDLTRAKRRRGRWLFEVYPHPAMIRLFGLSRVLSYKKGSVAQRRAGLGGLRNHLATLADGSSGWRMSPTLRNALGKDLETLRGVHLKHYEDTLDAVFCAYLAWHCWRWGEERNDVFGSMSQGYIVVPKAAEGARLRRTATSETCLPQ